MKNKYDFCGWATRYNIKCSDGRTIAKDAFAHCDGKTVPVVWNHGHGEVQNVLGHALLEKRDEGIYAYGSFNDTDYGKHAKGMVMHGDITALSIYANKLVEQSVSNGKVVSHGEIRELSLVLAGANLGAYIEQVNISHSDEETPLEEANIYVSEEDTEFKHSDEASAEEPKTEEVVHADNEGNEDDETIQDVIDSMNEKQKTVLYILVGRAMEGDKADVIESKSDEKVEHSDEEDEETIQDVIDSMNEKQKTVLYTLVGQAIEESDKDTQSQGGNETMKHNVFENDSTNDKNVLTHADQEAIIALAKQNSVGSFQEAVKIYGEQNNKDLAHAFTNETIESLFPDHQWLKPGAPEVIKKDLGWVDHVMKGVHKSPISRVRTRQANAKEADLRALGYKKENQKEYMGVVGLINRHTDPQTIYVKDKLNRDDIIDITDFNVVEYQYGFMKDALYEEIATAIMIGDGREEGVDDKIYETHVRSIWNDEELYTIHKDVNYEEMAAELQGSNTAANFGENYIWAEAMVQSALYAREQYKGSGNLTFYCTPHFVNVMLLARDLNGRRIYNSKADLEAALNVASIQTAEQFENKTRTTKDGKTKKLIGIFVNLSDYQVGSTKGGEITKFEDFDIDFNQYKYLLETRMSGALTRIKSAIALEEDVTE